MLLKNTTLRYPILLIRSITKRSFESLSELAETSGKTIRRWLMPSDRYYEALKKLLIKEFSDAKSLFLIFDDTLLKKAHSTYIEGSGDFYDTQMFRRIRALKLLVAMLTNGKVALPFNATLLFSKELDPLTNEKRSDWIKRIIIAIQKLFPDARIIVVADGAFATKDFLKWCIDNNIAVEVRIRSNSSVIYKEKKIMIRDIETLRRKGLQMARTISVLWHEIPLFITAERRIDRHGDETIVYQASTFKARPMQHVKIYKLRWKIEKMFRTVKQYLGLQECFSRKLEAQDSHIAATLFAYGILECERRDQSYPTVEKAIRTAKHKKGKDLDLYIARLDGVIGSSNV